MYGNLNVHIGCAGRSVRFPPTLQVSRQTSTGKMTFNKVFGKPVVCFMYREDSTVFVFSIIDRSEWKEFGGMHPGSTAPSIPYQHILAPSVRSLDLDERIPAPPLRVDHNSV